MKNFKSIKNKKGMTLVEIIVSVAILSIIAVFIITVFASSNNIIGNNAILKRNGENAAAGIENKMAGLGADTDISIVGQQDASVTVTFGTNSVVTSGKIVASSDKNSTEKYYYFVPN